MPLRLSVWSTLALACAASSGCGTGYTKSGGEWSYVILNESVGREVRKVDADVATFRVLEDPKYARDKNHVYRSGLVLEGFDGGSFEFLPGCNYARDRNHVYYRDSIVVDADRDTFRVLGFPYGRDAKNVYCGSLRMNVERPADFRVLQEGDPFGTSYFDSTDDLVLRLGEEFSGRRVEYEAKGGDDRYRIAATCSGAATDGVWIFDGPKRSRRVP
ncbi:DKNYY domain-containing protein [Paludisphaera soli]|uniref:DKNYY domain-containing protein n=1 Tax=Paludisphaera soli TaxID=2712865 RepID=UPI0013EE13FD|nr:DKNYY domain-containing protein [Paludisphaera soli]